MNRRTDYEYFVVQHEPSGHYVLGINPSEDRLELTGDIRLAKKYKVFSEAQHDFIFFPHGEEYVYKKVHSRWVVEQGGKGLTSMYEAHKKMCEEARKIWGDDQKEDKELLKKMFAFGVTGATLLILVLYVISRIVS